MGAKKCKDYEVYMTDQCRREYRRACKRMDSGLRGAIESELDKLRGAGTSLNATWTACAPFTSTGFPTGWCTM